ncbi:carboxypeptidase regulatory-like domain-containing protein [Nocardioides sp. YIM 152315]|uniref:carboxypeptidase regulatory-like domain-containing protein n=1 Tax=Nocardioides sp. YIM 152315 TaxID=3031760 RepID=UPI0023DBEE94|nr:carboxypeptidase regulatory-like domain-containing protein [Nocardioides sp. YIM 152315]MDF1603297.1 carboxypeptidase regulatory-like domain-containing protein [Nocardioides sp. YIM 152315]
MYVEISPRRLTAVPGLAQALTITISNTSDVIAGFTVRILGADPSWVELEETELSLFPDETRAVVAQLRVPEGMVAGERRIAVQVRELTPPESTSIEDVVLVVPEARSVQVRVDPMTQTAGKRARYGLLIDNTGNTPITSRLTGTDAEGQVRFEFEPPSLDLPPGEHAVVELRARAKRPLVGGPLVRVLDIGLEDPPATSGTAAAPPSVDQKLSVGRSTKHPAAPSVRSDDPPLVSATFLQKAVVTRGPLSLLGLLFALSVFAVVITLALSRIVGQSVADRNLALEIAQARNAAATSGGSGLSGTVRLLTSGDAVRGVAVDVYPAGDTSKPIATTSTDKAGAWEVADLPAGDYKVTFLGAGFVQLWYPQALSADNAETVTLDTNTRRTGLDVSLGGVPASVAGSVVGADVAGATLALTLPLAGAGDDGAVVQTVPIGSDGTFELTDVPSPNVYDLVVSKTGFATSTQQIDVAAGEERTGIEVTLRKGDGLIDGVVGSSAGPLGGVTIVATSGQSEVTTLSLTGADEGSFTIRSLPTPGSYTIAASKAGYASQTITVSLARGQHLTGMALTLGKSSGSLSGSVSLMPDGNPLPGVAVTVTDGENTTVTATQGSDDIGAWTVGGLAIPGTYTVSFSRSDLETQTLGVSLDAAGNISSGNQGATVTRAGITVAMQPSTAVLHGTIRQPVSAGSADRPPVGEVTVQLTSGTTSYSVITASVPSAKAGQYRIEGIPPGTYTVSVSRNGVSPTSEIIELVAGQDRPYSPLLAAAASISGTVVLNGQRVPAGWYVDLFRASTYPEDPYRTVRTAADGTFSFPDVDAPEVYIVEVRPTRGSSPSGSRTVQLAASDQRTITVRAEP